MILTINKRPIRIQILKIKQMKTQIKIKKKNKTNKIIRLHLQLHLQNNNKMILTRLIMEII
jgi:hypothetical protein